MNRQQMRQAQRQLRKQVVHKYCHFAIKKVAEEVAGAAYEDLMHDDGLYKAWQEQNLDAKNGKELQDRFIKKNWPKFIEFAVTALKTQLVDPRVPDLQKEEIMDILQKNQELQNSVGRSKVVGIGTPLQ